jgi:glycosyltransferase involved in cell wall biosynthesis
MRIVHVIARLNDGGPARVLASLGRELAARGHHLVVLAGRCDADEPDLGDRLRACGLAVEMVPGLGRRLSPVDDARAFAFILARLRALAPDIVHTHTTKAGALGRLAARWLDLPCLHTYHGHVLRGYFPHVANLALRWGERLVAGNCHHQALTESQLHDLRDRCRIGRPRRWHCLPIPVAPVTVRSAPWHQRLVPGRPVIGFLGRLAPIKDAALWLEAFSVLARNRPIQGLVCGDGGERARLAAAATRRGLPVLFTGFVPADEAFAAMDVLLISSRNEGLPLVAVEAGGVVGREPVPVVAPPVGGLADLIREGAVEGAARTPEGLAAACARLLDDAERRRRRAALGAALARRLAPAALVGAYESLYHVVSGERR